MTGAGHGDQGDLAEMLRLLRRQHRTDTLLDLYEHASENGLDAEIPEHIQAQRDTLGERASIGELRQEWTKGETIPLTPEAEQFLDEWARAIDELEEKRMKGR